MRRLFSLAPPLCAYFVSYFPAKYFVVVANSSRVDGLRVLSEGSFLGGLSFVADEPTRLYVVNRSTGDHVATYEAEPSFFFHIANSFDVAEKDGDESVCIDICRYPDMAVFQAMGVDNMVRGPGDGSIPRNKLTRYVLKSIKSVSESSRKMLGKAVERVLSPKACDLPYINEAFRGRENYRYVYGISQGASGDWFSGVTKIDLETGADCTYAPAGCHLSEPIFVADPTVSAADEDTGVLLLVEIDSSNPTRSALVVLDAKSMSEVARCESDRVIPFSFHGSFFRQ